MDENNQIKKILSQRKTGVTFNITNESSYTRPKKPMKFCEAVIASFNSSILLYPSDIECPGAKRAFGFLREDKKFASIISEETLIAQRFIENAIHEIPQYKPPIRNILLGNHKNPEIIIALLKPQAITSLIFHYALLYQKKPIISSYFFMSVCANIAVQTKLTNTISISFGCPESRKEGRVQEDEVIIGIPPIL